MKHLFIAKDGQAHTTNAVDLPADFKFGCICDDGTEAPPTARWYRTQRERDAHIESWERSTLFKSEEPADNKPTVWLKVTRSAPPTLVPL